MKASDSNLISIYNLARLFVGFILIATGILMAINARLGLGPWGIFHMGISIQTGMSFGRVAQITGFVLIIIALFWSIGPGLGTILNMYFVGFFIDVIEGLGLLKTPDSVIARIAMLVLGVPVFCYGVYLYISCRMGAGPRDALMLGIVKKTRFSLAQVKVTMDISLSMIGFILGGPLGVGKIIIVFSIGPFLQKIFKLKNIDPKKLEQSTLIDFHTGRGKGE